MEGGNEYLDETELVKKAVDGNDQSAEVVVEVAGQNWGDAVTEVGHGGEMDGVLQGCDGTENLEWAAAAPCSEDCVGEDERVAEKGVEGALKMRADAGEAEDGNVVGVEAEMDNADGRVDGVGKSVGQADGVDAVDGGHPECDGRDVEARIAGKTAKDEGLKDDARRGGQGDL